MIAVDTNILVYAHREDSPFHEAACRRVTELAEGRATWAIPWPCLHEFRHRGASTYQPQPTPLIRALEQVETWLESPTLTLLGRVGGALGDILGVTRWWPSLPGRRSIMRGSLRCAGSMACVSCGRRTRFQPFSPARGN